jgi:hypothetical protein
LFGILGQLLPLDGIFMGFTLHLLMHVVQWLVLQRYIPAIVTSLLALPYCGYTLLVVVRQNIFQPDEIAIWTVVGVVVVAFNVLLAHKLGERFEA